MKRIRFILLVVGFAWPFLGSSQTQHAVFSHDLFHFSDKINMQTDQNKKNMPRYLENLKFQNATSSWNSYGLQMTGKAYRAYFNSHLLNYKKFLKSRETTELLLPNRNYTGGHLADNYTWDRV